MEALSTRDANLDNVINRYKSEFWFIKKKKKKKRKKGGIGFLTFASSNFVKTDEERGDELMPVFLDLPALEWWRGLS